MRLAMAVLVAAIVSGCGVSKAQFDSKALEAENYRRQYQDEAGKTSALEQKVAELQKRADEAEKAKAELEQQLGEVDGKRRDAEEKLEQANALNAELAEGSRKLKEAKEALEKKSQEYEALASSLRDEIKSGKVELSELRGRMVVKMKDKILFSSGSVKIAKEGQAALAKVAEALKGVQGKLIRVEGHTDNVPVDPKGPFASNWELSTARSLEVVKLLIDQGVPPTMVSAAGYGEFQPVASNATAAGKSLNRRIEIVLAPGEQAPGVVKPSPPAAKGGKKRTR